MTPAVLPHTRLSIVNSTVYPNALGRDVLCFIVSVTVRPPNAQPTTWSIAKLFSAFVDLDVKVKAKSGKGRKEWKSMIAPLPEGRAWKDFAPSKIDQRKKALETYLQSLLVAPLSDKSDLCEFLSTDQVQAKQSGAMKEGYLTKKGKNFGGWKTRYFVLDGPVMEYYESVRQNLISRVDRG
jgi:RalA-binding protein 1